MESDKQQKLFANALIGIGGMTFVLSDTFLADSGGKGIVSGVGVGICVVGGMMAVMLWRASRRR